MARRKIASGGTRSPSHSPGPAPTSNDEGESSALAPVLEVSAYNPPFTSCALVTGGTGFMGSYLVQQLDAVACALGTRVVYLDVNPPRPDMPLLRRSTFHQCSLTDAAAVSRLFERSRPDTVFHCASIIDCRPRPVAQLDTVNVDGTQLIIDLCLKYGAQRLVYTSSIEVTYHDNRCDNVDETRDYPGKATQGYQRTKIAAEQLVLAANNKGDGQLVTCSLRPGHIYGAGDDLFFLAKVGVNFGPQVLPVLCGNGGAPMSMVHVENMAAAHLIAAQHLHRTVASNPVAGEAFNISDFSQNIVSLYAEAAGARKPFVTLPYWLLWLLVRLAVLLSIVFYTIFCGLQILHPKTGLHEAALTAGLPATMNTAKAQRVLGYRPLVTKRISNVHCAEWIAAGGGQEGGVSEAQITPLLTVAVVN